MIKVNHALVCGEHEPFTRVRVGYDVASLVPSAKARTAPPVVGISWRGSEQESGQRKDGKGSWTPHSITVSDDGYGVEYM